ncbi:hypothetical protein [Marinilabilia sp.]
MKQGQHNIIIRMAALFMIAATSLLIVNKALYTHTHITKEGQIIAHSHPFKQETGNNSGTGHQHTSVQFHFLDNLQLLFPALFLSILIFLFRNNEKHTTRLKSRVYEAHIVCQYGRAPPAL